MIHDSTRTTPTRMRHATILALLAFATGGMTTACSFGEVYLHDPLLRQVALEEVQLHYSSLVRWSAFHKAAKYVEPDAREDFLAALPSLEEFRFSDFESEPVELDPETGEATIHVTYKGYSTRSPFEIKIRETQHWKRGSIRNDWRVTPEFEGFGEAGIAKAD